MKQYLDLVRTVLDSGSWVENRTGIRTCMIPGAMLRFDLAAGFPILTTKRVAFKTAMGELVGFLRGITNAAEFRALGCKVWDQNANENAQWLASPFRRGADDLGKIYGAQWVKWPAYKVLDSKQEAQVADALARGYKILTQFETTSEAGGTTQLLLAKSINQVRHCLDTLINNPSDRRILFHAWNPAQLEEMALMPCHLLYQFLPNVAKRELSLCLTIRSNDLGLGNPINCISAAALMHLVGRLTGFSPKWLTIFIGDTHVYENHVEFLTEQMTREPYDLPRLVLSDRIPDFAKTGRYEPEWLEQVEPSDFSLEGYRHHAALTAPMAV
jgi:thymidylate synthase